MKEYGKVEINSYKLNSVARGKGSINIKEVKSKKNIGIKKKNEVMIKKSGTNLIATKGSHIPRLKSYGVAVKANIIQKGQKANKLSLSKQLLNTKLQEKENCTGNNWTENQKMMRRIVEQNRIEKFCQSIQRKKCCNQSASETLPNSVVFGMVQYNKCKSDIFMEFKSSVSQISDIWLKISADLSNTLKNLKNPLFCDSMDFEMEKVKIQKAIMHAWSFTLLTTKNVISETQEQFRGKEKREYEDIICSDLRDLKLTGESDEFEETKNENCKQLKSNENKEIICEGVHSKQHIIYEGGDLLNLKKIKLEDVKKHAPLSITTPLQTHDEEAEQIQDSKRNENSVTTLKNRIIQLQKICNDYSQIWNDIQLRLTNFNKQVQWDEPLPRQKFLTEGKEVEFGVEKLGQEFDLLTKMNFILWQQKLLLDKHSSLNVEKADKRIVIDEDKFQIFQVLKEQNITDKIHSAKQCSINQLKEILDLMKKQETFSYSQKHLMESKVEEFKTNVVIQEQ